MWSPYLLEVELADEAVSRLTNREDQYCAAVRVLGRPLGCTIDTIGFDRARSPHEPPHRPTELLQVIRSTILWLREIALEPAGPPPVSW